MKMSSLELICTHRFPDSAAVFVDKKTDDIYTMGKAEEELEPHVQNSEKHQYLKMLRSSERSIQEPDRVFTSLSDASQYIRALGAFDSMMDYVIILYKFACCKKTSPL